MDVALVNSSSKTLRNSFSAPRINHRNCDGINPVRQLQNEKNDIAHTRARPSQHAQDCRDEILKLARCVRALWLVNPLSVLGCNPP